MKKLLVLLALLPLMSFGQTTYLSQSCITPNTNGFNVGDIITIKFEGIYQSAIPNLVQFDYQYNNKLLEKVDHTFTPTGQITGIQTTLNHWDGYKFNPDTRYGIDNLSKQFTWYNGGNGSYSGNADWSVERITIQSTKTLPSSTPWIYVRFRIKDKFPYGYTDYSKVAMLNWAKFQKQSPSTLYDVVAQNQTLALSPVKGGDAGTVFIRLHTPVPNKAYYKYRIEHTGTQQTVAQGYFDSTGTAAVPGLVNDVDYHVYIEVDNNIAWSWLNDVVTVSDAFLDFKQAIGASTTGPGDIANIFSYQIQYLLGEVTNDGVVDFDDSYVMLNHITGTTTSGWFTSSANGGRNIWGRIENYGASTDQYYFGQNQYIRPTDAEKVFDFVHGFQGDVDFSHSYVPTAEGSTNYNSSAMRTIASKAKIAANAETYNLEVSTSLVDGKVVLTTNLTMEQLAGIQFNIQYDQSVLEFDSVKFDTGNQTTNFATPRGNTLYIGSLDSTGLTAIKTGTPYKLVFNTKTPITNTAGLIYFKLAEAVKQDGTKVILKIQ